MRIKKSFLKISISVFAGLGLLVAFLPKAFWGESTNLEKIEAGSKKVLKSFEDNLKINPAEADECPPSGGGYTGGDMA